MTSRAHAPSTNATWAWLTGQLNGRPLPSVVAIIGLGDGRLLDALDRHAPATRVLALEPDAAAARAFSAGSDYQAWHASKRLAYLSGPDYAGADEAWRVFPNTDDEPVVVVNPDLSRNPDVTRDDVGRAAQVLKKILFGVKGNREARRRFAPRYLVNAIRNIPAMLAGSDVRALANAYTNIPAVIVGAGPSLDDAIDDLRELADRALIISTDTALRPLLMSGISPQLVVGLDPSELNMRHFMALPECKDIWLVSEMALDRRATAVFEGRTFWFRASNHQPAPWLREQGIDIGQLDVWGSVLTGAFQLAVLAGCDPIVAVGADLAFTGGRPYARGTTYEFDWAWSAAQGIAVSDSWERQIAANQPIVVSDLHGRDTRSTRSLLSFRDWLVSKAASSGRRVVNATGAGIFFGDRIERRALGDVLLDAHDIAPVGTFVRKVATLDRAAAAARLSDLGEAVLCGRMSEAPLAAWAGFSGPDFNPSALACALREASTAVRAGHLGPRSEEAVSWSRLIDSARTHDVLRMLPEAVTWYRESLSTPVASGPRDAVERDAPTAALLERMFDDVEEAIAQVGEVVPNPRVAPDVDMPVSEAYLWPDSTRWAILTFEGLLGGASTAAGAAEAAAYWQRPVRPRHAANPASVEHRSAAARARAVLAQQLSRRLPEDRAMTTELMRYKTADPQNARRLTGCLDVIGVKRRAVGGDLVAPSLVRPRVLTEEGFPPSTVAYGDARGVVVVAPGARQSVLVREDGSREPHLSWPHAIVCELPFGSDGAVAWTTDIGPRLEQRRNYVMHRAFNDGAITTERLPFTPSRGVFWGGRLLWTCTPIGVGFWDPENGGWFELPEHSIASIEPEIDALLLVPRAPGANGTVERRRTTQGWRWRPGEQAQAVELGPYGGSVCSADAHGWRARVYSDADLIELVSKDATVLMTCYYPLRAAWCGCSLMVSTGDRDVLLFEDLIGRLDRAVSAAAAEAMEGDAGR